MEDYNIKLQKYINELQKTGNRLKYLDLYKICDSIDLSGAQGTGDALVSACSTLLTNNFWNMKINYGYVVKAKMNSEIPFFGWSNSISGRNGVKHGDIIIRTGNLTFIVIEAPTADIYKPTYSSDTLTWTFTESGTATSTTIVESALKYDGVFSSCNITQTVTDYHINSSNKKLYKNNNELFTITSNYIPHIIFYIEDTGNITKEINLNYKLIYDSSSNKYSIEFHEKYAYDKIKMVVR